MCKLVPELEKDLGRHVMLLKDTHCNKSIYDIPVFFLLLMVSLIPALLLETANQSTESSDSERSVEDVRYLCVERI